MNKINQIMEIGKDPLTIDKVIDVARNGVKIKIDESVKQKMNETWDHVESAVDQACEVAKKYKNIPLGELEPREI